jgi:hypothetical protein
VTRGGGGGEPLSRRGFLKNSAAAALAAGTYGLIESLTPPLVRLETLAAAAVEVLPVEQYLFSGTRTLTSNGVLVDVPPIHHLVVTATLNVGTTAADLKAAQKELEALLARMESDGLLTYTPAGLGLALCWGLPYFQHRLPAAALAQLPQDLASPLVGGHHQQALLGSVRFASDPASTILEENEVAVVMASDSVSHLDTAYSTLFEGSLKGLFRVMSGRRGFVDASKLGTGRPSVTKQFALANKLPGAASIPDEAELFLGFTSTQSAALGPGKIANFESLGMTNQTATSYFAGGTILALSHIFEDIAGWYANNGFSERVQATFRPSLAGTVKPGTLTVPEGVNEIETRADLMNDVATYGIVGHAGSMQPVSRLAKTTGGYPAGTPVPVRADFNTVDNPFAFSAEPVRDKWSSTPVAGVHFLTYVPTSNYFRRLREAMDGGAQGGPQAYQVFARAAGLTTTHRQNFLVPPRARRSFPLAELA